MALKRMAIIAGSGSNYLLPGTNWKLHDETNTPYGSPSSVIAETKFNDINLYRLFRHGDSHSIPPHRINYRANIWALSSLGCELIVATAAVGGIRANLNLGSLVLPHQIIDYTWGRDTTFFDGEDGTVGHLDITEPYTNWTRRGLINAAKNVGIPIFTNAVYAITQGPRFETTAEVNRIEKDGGDIVGMTGMPEAALAAEKSIAYACLSIVVNRAAGQDTTPITHTAISQACEEGYRQINEIIGQFLANVDSMEIFSAESNIL